MIDLSDPRTMALLEAVGARYWWGSGALEDGLGAWPVGPWDCSGLAQAALLRLGLVAAGAWRDKGAADLAQACDPVPLGSELPGDLVFYDSDRGR